MARVRWVRGAAAGGRNAACSRGVGPRTRGSHGQAACLSSSPSVQLHIW